MSSTRFLVSFLVAAASLSQVRAADSTVPADPLLQTELKQQQIRSVTDRVAVQLGEIVTEFQRNNLAGRDVDNLSQIQTVLGNLSRQEMDRVIRLLQEARQNEQSSGERIADAFSRQKGIIIQLQQLIDEYRRQQALHDISIRLKELADKQAGNMRLGVWLARNTGGKSLQAFDESQKLNLRLQETEQIALKDEVSRQLAKLQALSKETVDGAAAARVRSGLARIKQGALLSTLDSASADLGVGKLLSAAGNEKRSRDELREIARLLVLSEDPAETLRQALRDLDRAVEHQKDVFAQTQNIDKKDEGFLVEAMQAEVVDQTDLVREDVQKLAPVATEYLRNATDRMQEARALLSEHNAKAQREDAPPKQEQALVHLEQARQALEEQLAKAELAKAAPPDGILELKALQDELRLVVAEQQELRRKTAAAAREDLSVSAPDQGSLNDKTQALQERAGRLSEPAAQSLSEAAAQMRKAQNSLAQGQNNEPAQQAALDALQKAEAQLNTELTLAQQAHEELDRLADLGSRLGEVIQKQEEIEFATGQVASEAKPPPLGKMARDQEHLGEQTGQLGQEAAASMPEAAAHLNDAKREMNEAKSELDKPAAKAAQPRQADALKKLYEAKTEMEQRLEQLRKMLGAPETPALEDAAALIEKAQQNVGAAMNEMQQAEFPPGSKQSSASSLKKAAQELGQASKTISPLTAGQKGSLPKSVQTALQSAQGALSTGAAKATGGKSSEAQLNATFAADSLAQAKAALALAQAGLGSEAAQPGQGQGQAQGKGQGQGEGQGQGQGQGKGKGQGKGQGQGQGEGDAEPGLQGSGRKGNWTGTGNGEVGAGGLRGTGTFTGLPQRDRAAIRQSQAEKYPQEYGPLVEQYLKNLSDQAGK